MRTNSNSRIYFLLAILLLNLGIIHHSEAQTVVCTGGVPTYTLNFTGNPGGVWVSPQLTRQGNCCGTTSPDRCLRFDFIADTGAAAISFEIASGAVPPGALFYQINCGPQTQVGQYTCITGSGTLTFCKPGNNTNTYRVTSIPKPRFPLDDTVRQGCTKQIKMLGFRDDSVRITSIFPGAVGAYDSYLSCTTGCSDPFVTPGPGAPAYVDYLASGYPTADLCGYNTRLTDTIRVYFYPELIASVTPNPGSFCPASPGVNLTASATGGIGGYTYKWFNGSTLVGTSAVYQANAVGIYTVIVNDGLGASCPTDSVSVPVNAANVVVSTAAVNASCFNTASGSATASVTGGAFPYTYQWNTIPVQTTETATGLASGTYNVVVTDAGGCSQTATVSITDPPALTLQIDSLQQVGCNGEYTGALYVDANGGTAPYQYLWNNGATDQDLINIPAGNYFLTVTDANGCTDTISQEITQPDSLSPLIDNYSLTVTNVSCFSGSNGAAVVDVSGGTPPYQYFWSNGGTDSLVTNLSAGTLEVLVRDANGCSISNSSVTVTEPPILIAAVQNLSVFLGGNNVSCNGSSDGSIDLEVMGGTPGYSYQWSNADSAQDPTGLSAGIYDVVVSDANGCIAVTSATLTEPDQLSNAISSPIYNGYNIPCKGDSSGMVFNSVTGGTEPYTYNWSNGNAIDSLSFVAAGFYSVDIYDANGCSRTDTITLTEPDTLYPRIETTVVFGNFNIPCYGDSAGSAWVVVTGGTAPFSFTWSDGSTNDTIFSVPAGEVWVQVRDNNLCFGIDTAVLIQPEPLFASLSINSNPSCNGTSDAQAVVSVLGGTTPYSYLWSNNSTSDVLDQVPAGTYTIEITDANGCNYVDSVVITEPELLTATLTPSLYPSGDNISCHGASNGSIDLTVNGGTAPFQFAWSNSDNNEDLYNLPAGTYSVDVTDANGCTAQATITMTEPQPLNVDTVFSSEFLGGWNISCNAGDNGSVFSSVSGGSQPYAWYWSNGDTTQNISNVSVTIYIVTVTDLNGCTAQDSITLDEPTPLVTSINAQTNVDCFGNSNGSVTISASGSTPPYRYSIDGSNYQSSPTFSGLVAGNYNINVLDTNGCGMIMGVTIQEPSAPLVSAVLSTANVDCFGAATGSGQLTVSGGTQPYEFSLNNGTAVSDSLFSGLTAGNYAVVVTDANGCSSTSSFAITENTQLTGSATPTAANCNQNNGTATVSVSGGVGPYSYNWSPGSATTDVITGLSAGNYDVTVTDNLGCTFTATTTVTTTPALNASVTAQTGNDCFGQTNGSATITATDGTAPYAYAWSSSLGTNPSVSGLATGSYTCTVTDQDNCSTTVTVNIQGPIAPLSSSITSPVDVNCFGASTGSSTVSATGGTNPYTYSLNNGTAVTDSVFSSLSAGNYNVLITDANGCTATNSFTISENPQINGTASATAANCNQNNGTATISSVSGGVAPYAYSWSPGGGTTASVTGLGAGNYTVTVTDNLGCTFTASATVTTTTLLTANVTSQTDNLCFGQNSGSATVTATNGTGPYTYVWSPAGGSLPTASSLTAGTYVCTITDQDNCSTTATAVITEPALLQANLTVSPATCTGTANATASVNVQGGTQGYSYVWSDGSTGSTASGLSAGPVSVTVTDVNGCTTTALGTVDPNSNITATLNITGATCNAYTDGVASVDPPSGAYPPFTYLWSTSSTATSISGLSAGNYFVTITDAKGCTVQLQASVTEPAPLSVFAGSDSSVCLNTLQLYASDLYSGQWSSSNSLISFVNPSSNNTVVNGLVSGPNTLMWTVTSGVCSDSATVSITLLGDLECKFELPSGFTPNGDGFNDGYVIHGIGLYPDNVFRVFNRWGNEVYYREDYQNADWYGQNKSGDLLPEGTYFVIFEVVGKDVQRSTYVDLRRGQK